MKAVVLNSALFVAAVSASRQTAYGQCGGAEYTGPKSCMQGFTCTFKNAWYSQCVPRTSAKAWAQCGGMEWSGPTSCIRGYSCKALNEWYSQCVPGSAPVYTPPTPPTSVVISSVLPIVTITPTKPPPTPIVPTPTTPPATKPTTLGTCSSKSPPANAGSVQFAGVNIAGFDFGCGTDGTCSTSGSYGALGAAYNRPDGASQMKHFVADGLNTFRLPVGWQWLTNNVVGGDLDTTNFGQYDLLMQSCLASGAYCIIDVHNYARWNGGIIGQGGPTNEQFAALWTSLATKYKSEDKVMFGIVNEPHDVPNIATWAVTVQTAVTAIRAAGATAQKILLPGNNWTKASTLISTGSLAALSAISNPDGTTTNLILDIHMYLDSDTSGTNSECVSNNIDTAFAPLAQALRCSGRQALLTETGGGNTDSCVTYLNQQLQYLNQNNDVYLGYLGWAAGSFDASYTLTLTPNADGSDQRIVSESLVPNFHPAR